MIGLLCASMIEKSAARRKQEEADLVIHHICACERSSETR